MGINWDDMWSFSVSPWELVLRGTLMFWLILILLRLGGRRDIGSVGTADILLVVIIADAASNGMSADYKSVAEGAVLVTTLVFWSVAVDRLCYFFPLIDRLLEPRRIVLIKDGQVQRRGMRKEYVTMEELESELRKNGVDAVDKVWRAYMEATGEISVLTYDGTGKKKP